MNPESDERRPPWRRPEIEEIGVADPPTCNPGWPQAVLCDVPNPQPGVGCNQKGRSFS